MAKRYGELADALEDLSLHYRFDGRGMVARDYQLAASEIRTVEHIPPNPAELSGVSVKVRDSIAEWRALGCIPKLEEFEEERPYLTNLTRVAKVGPKTAKKLNEEAGIETVDDIRELSDNGELEEITGIGPKTATTIRRSIAQLKS